MDIGNWEATKDLNELYTHIRDLGLETNLAELEAFGFTTIEGALTPEQVDRARTAIVSAAEKRWGRSIDIENEQDNEGIDLVPFLLYRDEVFEEVLLNPGPLALVTYLMGQHVMLSSMTSHFKSPGGQPIQLHSDTGNGMVREVLTSVISGPTPAM